jgi:hypothetical protein
MRESKKRWWVEYCDHADSPVWCVANMQNGRKGWPCEGYRTKEEAAQDLLIWLPQQVVVEHGGAYRIRFGGPLPRHWQVTGYPFSERLKPSWMADVPLVAKYFYKYASLDGYDYEHVI